MAILDTDIAARIALGMVLDMALGMVLVILRRADTIALDLPMGRTVHQGTRAALELIAEGASYLRRIGSGSAIALYISRQVLLDSSLCRLICIQHRRCFA
jgi:hypothetical protein